MTERLPTDGKKPLGEGAIIVVPSPERSLVAARHRYLVIRRSAAVIAPGRLCFPGGKCLPGETPNKTAEREFREEIGAEAVIAREIWQNVTPWGVFCLKLEAFQSRLTTQVIQIEHRFNRNGPIRRDNDRGRLRVAADSFFQGSPIRKVFLANLPRRRRLRRPKQPNRHGLLLGKLYFLLFGRRAGESQVHRQKPFQLVEIRG